MKVSVIIPTLNEARALARTLDRLLAAGPDEIVIADGGSSDSTRDIAAGYPVRVVDCRQGRAVQMNTAAEAATGDLLLFLHADSRVEPEGFDAMRQSMDNGRWLGGAFCLKIESPRPVLNWISRLANWRSRWFHLVYGDQAIFVRRETFRDLGGFAPLPICEDLEFFRRLKRRGPVLLLPQAAVTSSRRWDTDGVAYTTFRNTVIAAAFLFGFPPRILSRWYPPRR